MLMRNFLILGTALMAAACGGNASNTPVASGASSTQAASTGSPLAGNFNGTWKNTTFGSSGTLNVKFTVTGSQAAALVTVTGNVFGGSAPGPVTFNGTLDSNGFASDSTVDTFGHCVIKVTPAGAVTVHCDQIPNPMIATLDVNGTWNGSGGNMTYVVTFASGGGTANGTVTFTKG